MLGGDNVESVEMIGLKIKKIRKELNLSQQALAGADFTKSYISKIERGLVNPSMKALEIISDRLNKPVSFFIEDNKGGTFRPRLILDGLNLFDEGKYNESLGKFNSVLGYKDQVDEDLLIKVYYYIGDIYFKQEKYETCIEFCNKVIEEIDDYESSYAFKIYFILGEAYYASGNKEESFNIFVKAEKFLTNPNITIAINDKIDILYDLGVIYIQRGKANVGKKYLENIIDISKKEKIITETVLSTFSALSETANIVEKDPDKSLSYLNHHIVWLYEYFGDYSRLGSLYFKYGHSYLEKNEIEKAKEYLSKIKEMDHLVKDKQSKIKFTVSSLYYEGRIAQKEGDTPKAEELLLRALEISKDKKVGNITIIILTKLGELYYNKGKLEKGLDYLEAAQQVSEANKFSISLPEIYQLMGKIYIALGEIDKGQDYYDKAFKLLKEQ